MALAAPVLLAGHHVVDEFNSGEAALDECLEKRARANLAAGASRVFVVCEDGFRSCRLEGLAPHELVAGY